MCERTCPLCGSSEHIESFGVTGLYLLCTCGNVLAHRFDSQAAPLDCADPEAYARERSFVLAGAEARDPADDAIYRLVSREGE